MKLKVERVDTWVASLRDKSGALAAKLTDLAKAGVNLEFVVARRAPDKPGAGVVFAAPIKGAAAVRAAKKNGLRKSNHLHTVRIVGPDRRGQGARITRALAEKGLNLRGISAAAMRRQFVVYIALDTAADAARAVRIVQRL